MTNEQVPLGQEVFGPYIVYERLGVGGMATVHRAKERGIEGFERIVALKRLLPHLAEDASFVKSFVREAKLASMLQHANIVQLYELGRVGTTYFISMEYIDGRDVRRILRQARKVTGPPTINVTLALLIQLCDALDYAHTRTDEDGQPLGIVHRDVSPSNLLVTRSGHLKVIDFGIAKAQAQQLRTHTGRVKGKLAYMAPEAISGKELDARSDVFSAGVIAHELLTARPLFASKNEYQTLIKVQRGDVVPPSTFNQAVPPELDAIVARALARDPDHRFAHAAEMRDELHGVRIRYQLSATNREVSSWSEWAFSLEAPGNAFAGPMNTDSLVGVSQSRSQVPLNLPLRPPASDTPSTQSPIVAAAQQRHYHHHHHHEEEDAAEVAWGGGQEHDSGVAIELEDIPDVSSKYPAVPAGLAASGYTEGVRRPSGVTGNLDLPPGVHRTPTGRGSMTPSNWAYGSNDDVALPRRRSGSTSQDYGAVVAFDDTTRTPLVPNPADAVSFGAGITARRNNGLRNAVIALTVVAAIGIGAFVTMGRSGGAAVTKPPTPAEEPVGKVKFVVDPPDAIVRIAGMEPHSGSPYQIELEPGTHQIEIRRDGYKTWVTSLELSSGENQTLRVVLEQGGQATLSTLILDSTPQGLVAFLDGMETSQRTPLRMEIKPGAHVVTLRQNGVEVWRHEFIAQANANHEFHPSMTEAKKREREERARVAGLDRRPVRPSVPAPGSAAVGSSAGMEPGSSAPSEPSIDASETPPATPPVTEEPAGSAAAPGPRTADGTVAEPPTAPPVAPTPPAKNPVETKPAPPKAVPAIPQIIAPNAVKRVSGSMPNIRTTVRRGEVVPNTITTKLCIDPRGKVASAQVMTKVSDDVRSKLLEVFRDWRYTPYLQAGTAVPACFVVSFSIK